MRGGFLAEMRQASARRAREASRRVPPADLRAACRDAPRVRPFPATRSFGLIAEVKRRSPGRGRLADERADAVLRARAYADGGAAAISVLTETVRFGGSLRDLALVARGVALPVLRKDFLVDPYQILEARAHGASAVLLIVGLLGAGRTARLAETAFELGLTVLCEAHHPAEEATARALARHAPAGSWIVGINARDLGDLSVRTSRFAESVPDRSVPFAAESGLDDPHEVAQAAALGYRYALVGAALMRAADPATAVRSMLHAAREPAGEGLRCR